MVKGSYSLSENVNDAGDPRHLLKMIILSIGFFELQNVTISSKTKPICSLMYWEQTDFRAYNACHVYAHLYMTDLYSQVFKYTQTFLVGACYKMYLCHARCITLYALFERELKRDYLSTWLK